MDLSTISQPIKEGKGLLEKLKADTFDGYVRSTIDKLLADVDARKYSLADINTDEVEVLDLAIKHLSSGLLANAMYPFPVMVRIGELKARKLKVLGAQRPPEYANSVAYVGKPQLVVNNDNITVAA